MQSNLSKTSFFGAALGTMIKCYEYVLLAIFLTIVAPIITRTTHWLIFIGLGTLLSMEWVDKKHSPIYLEQAAFKGKDKP